MSGGRFRFRLSGLVAVLTIGFLIGPFIVVMGSSFDNARSYYVRFPPRDLSLTWYWQIPQKYIHGLEISVVIGVLAALAATLFGMMAAFGLVRGRIVADEALRAFFRLPIQIPLIVTGAVFLQFYYYVAALTGINPMMGIWGLVVAHIFIAMPYCVGAISAVLVRLDPALEEAAESLGATSWAVFRQVTLPILRPGIVAGMAYAFIMSFGDVPVSMFLVNGSDLTFPVMIFQDMQFDFQPSMLAASTIVVILSLILILAMQKLAGLDLVLPAPRK